MMIRSIYFKIPLSASRKQAENRLLRIISDVGLKSLLLHHLREIDFLWWKSSQLDRLFEILSKTIVYFHALFVNHQKTHEINCWIRDQKPSFSPPLFTFLIFLKSCLFIFHFLWNHPNHISKKKKKIKSHRFYFRDALPGFDKNMKSVFWNSLVLGEQKWVDELCHA